MPLVKPPALKIAQALCLGLIAIACAAPTSGRTSYERAGGPATVEQFISKDGTEIAAWKSGTGPALVLVHGTVADHTRWAPVMAALERQFTVYAMDRRGRAGSGDSAQYAIEREFEDVAAVVDGIGGPVDLVGHSYGALCALEASLLTRNLRRLVAYEPPLPAGDPIYPPGIIDRLQAMLDAGDREDVVVTFLREVARVPGQQLELMRSLPAWAARVAAAHTIPRELRAHEAYVFRGEKFRHLQVPTLLLLGGDSPPLFRSAIDAAHAAFAGSRVAVMPGQQHVAIDTGPDLFLQEVLAFLHEG